MSRTSIYRTNDRGDELLAYIDDRCVDPLSGQTDYLAVRGSGFHATKGRLQVTADVASNSYTGAYTYIEDRTVLVFEGFATLFDVLQTYTPTTSSLGFHVPVMPEGMAAADHFDTYWGSLTHPLDFTQAHALQCGYPATAPHDGDYLTVADTVPTPAPGQGVYYVTAATYQGATRYGRKTTARHLTGRDPALLPTCTP